MNNKTIQAYIKIIFWKIFHKIKWIEILRTFSGNPQNKNQLQLMSCIDFRTGASTYLDIRNYPKFLSVVNNKVQTICIFYILISPHVIDCDAENDIQVRHESKRMCPFSFPKYCNIYSLPGIHAMRKAQKSLERFWASISSICWESTWRIASIYN